MLVATFLLHGGLYHRMLRVRVRLFRCFVSAGGLYSRSIITKHNVSLLKKYNTPPPSTNERLCNCRKNTECPLNGECLTKSLVYEATLKTNEDAFTYIGLTGDTFKSRYTAHKSSFTHEKYRTSTALSQKIWELKESNINYTLSWSILKKSHSYKGGGRGKCDLCLIEKLEILKRARLKGCLNSRTDFEQMQTPEKIHAGENI